MKRLTRSRANGKIAGVCAGLADYLDVDVTFVRAVWLALSIVPGAIIGGIVVYLLVWMIMPAGSENAAEATPRLTRSVTNSKVAGVCGGLAEYFGVDATPIRALWIVLSILPGAVVGGLLVYLAAWILIPKAHTVVLTAQTNVPA